MSNASTSGPGASPTRTSFGDYQGMHHDTSLPITATNVEHADVSTLITARLQGSLREEASNMAPTGEFVICGLQDMLLRGQVVSTHASQSGVLDCVETYAKKIDVIGYGLLNKGLFYVARDRDDARVNREKDSCFDAHLNSLREEVGLFPLDETGRICLEVLKLANQDEQYKYNLRCNAENTLLSFEQLLDYVKGCISYSQGTCTHFGDSESSIAQGMGLNWITLSYKHETYEGETRISQEKLKNIWSTIAEQSGVVDFCLWIDHVMRLRRYSDREWYEVGIEPYAVAKVVRYIRIDPSAQDGFLDISNGLWLTCEAILGISNKGLYCIFEGRNDVFVIDSGLGIGAKKSVEVLALCFLNGRLFKKRVYYQEEAQALTNWSVQTTIADLNSRFVDVPTMKRWIPQIVSLEGVPSIFNRLERHLGAMAVVHKPIAGHYWRGLWGVVPAVEFVLGRESVDSEYEESVCKVYSCLTCEKKLGVLEYLGEVITVSGLDKNVIDGDGHARLSVKPTPVERSMLQVGSSLSGITHLGGGHIVLCDDMKLIAELKLSQVRWQPCSCDN